MLLFTDFLFFATKKACYVTKKTGKRAKLFVLKIGKKRTDCYKASN